MGRDSYILKKTFVKPEEVSVCIDSIKPSRINCIEEMIYRGRNKVLDKIADSCENMMDNGSLSILWLTEETIEEMMEQLKEGMPQFINEYYGYASIEDMTSEDIEDITSNRDEVLSILKEILEEMKGDTSHNLVSYYYESDY